MNPERTVFTIKGKINRQSGYSDAYREAVLNGFVGTQEEWLRVIQGRLDAGENVTSREFYALLEDKRNKRFMGRK